MITPSVTLRSIGEKDKEVLSKLLHDYLMELLSEPGEYKHLSSYFTDPSYAAFFIYADGKMSGFVLVNKHTLVEKDAHSIAEFYIIPSYRRQGIGEQAAALAFKQFPGKWEVAQMQTNRPAVYFWRKVITDATMGEYKETARKANTWHVKTFDIS